jgi:crotonobetainyl-CoA:carnitine CoA-transferase CaiB-like acyl-CoA transferase
MPPSLEGMRVLDFGSDITGPYCRAPLAHLGAVVIKLRAVSDQMYGVRRCFPWGRPLASYMRRTCE